VPIEDHGPTNVSLNGPGVSDANLITVLERARHDDPRGWLHKVLSGAELGQPLGEVYVVRAAPGARRGDHLHNRMGEWFVVVEGAGQLCVEDPLSGAREARAVSAARPEACYVRAGLAHVLIGGADGMIAVAVAERDHDPDDVIAHVVAV